MPLPKGRLRRSSTTPVQRDSRQSKAAQPNPGWYAPLMVGLMILGLLWIVAVYLSGARYPIGAWGNWNLAVGFGFIIAGFIMTTNWR